MDMCKKIVICLHTLAFAKTQAKTGPKQLLLNTFQPEFIHAPKS